ncbi:MAG: ATP-binding protein [Planctomycetota bacterium]|nr:MAG: ATP-binding protein [Planctomycetota bacterium]
MDITSQPQLPVRPIARIAAATARERLAGYPILTMTGPRQSGKTTLARMLAPELPYVTLEDPDTRAFATEDPRAFLRQVSDGAILDEVQRVPALFSYLQGVVDADRRMGRFILTGSSQFELIESITQSLAGRASMLTLLPFSQGELQAANRAVDSVNALLHTGFFPPIHDRQIKPTPWLQDYVATYLERDVRQLLNIHNLGAFQRFIQLCAGRIGQLVNISSLAADAGITRVTAESWLSVLQASHVLFLVRPWFSNLGKRLIKTPKLYFCDCGLAAWFLGVQQAQHLQALPQRGALFENWIMTELLKAQSNRGIKPSLYFLRDKQGHEVDALIQTAPDTFQAIAIKSGETIASDFFNGLNYWRTTLKQHTLVPWIIHGGTAHQNRETATVLPWSDLSPLLDALA